MWRTWGRDPMAKAVKPPATPPPAPPGRREIPAPPGRSEIPPASAAIALFLFAKAEKEKKPEKEVSTKRDLRGSLVRLTSAAEAMQAYAMPRVEGRHEPGAGALTRTASRAAAVYST